MNGHYFLRLLPFPCSPSSAALRTGSQTLALGRAASVSVGMIKLFSALQRRRWLAPSDYRESRRYIGLWRLPLQQTAVLPGDPAILYFADGGLPGFVRYCVRH